jgi:DNA mismatch repair protein MLH3
MATNALLPLPASVVAKIKSSIVINTLNDAVLELFKNSLDASSTRVEINVDYGRGGCVIEDDGLGIPPTEFHEDGGLGKLYREFIFVSSFANLH